MSSYDLKHMNSNYLCIVLVTHSHIVNGDMVETSKAVSFRLYELDKLLTDDSKFWQYFQYTY